MAVKIQNNQIEFLLIEKFDPELYNNNNNNSFIYLLLLLIHFVVFLFLILFRLH